MNLKMFDIFKICLVPSGYAQYYDARLSDYNTRKLYMKTNYDGWFSSYGTVCRGYELE